MHRHPINCILPPHVLDEIETKGSSEQQEWVRLTRSISQSFRETRHSLAGIAAPSNLLAATGGKERAIYDARNGS